MADQWWSVPRKKLMENITLLWTLNEIIESPRENVMPDDEKSWRQLPYECEKTIADLLAFLSATHDDNCKIMAVCIEESRDHTQLAIRMASNTGDCLHVQRGFDEMAKILEQAHSRGTLRFHQTPIY